MNIKKILAFALAAMMCVCVLSACSSKDDGVEVDTNSAAESQLESTSDAEITPEFQMQNINGNTEEYTNADGKDIVKTESGAEVEVSGENFARLYREYKKVSGTGSDEEKELLEQLQLILEKLPDLD
ncbi:MAG: hypothetical protein IKA95_01480 [Clostridia bacterium]|nr:hypothetical protein [Clostridia bacterium]